MKKAYTYAGIAILCWSTVAIITKLMLGSLNNFQLLWANSFFAGASLLIACIANGSIRQLKEYSVKDIIISILIALPGTLLYYVLYYAGTGLMPASKAFIINYLWPIMTVLAACIILKEKFTARKTIAILLSFAGVVIVAFKDILGLNSKILIGSFFCILGAISYGVFSVLYGKFKYDKTLSIALGYTTTFLITTIINAVRGDLFVPSATQFAAFAFSGVITMALANTLWVIAITSGKTAKIANLAYITPFLSLLWARLILKEDIASTAVIGLLVIVLGIFIQLKDK